MHLISRHNSAVDNGRGIVLRVFAQENGIVYGRFTQVAFGVTFGHAGMDSFPQVAAGKMHFLSDIDVDHGQTRVLTQGHLFLVGQLCIFDNGVQNLAA